jgi:hypothetical protein
VPVLRGGDEVTAAQLPHDKRGEALCRHRQPGRCTWWCSYRRGVLCIGPVVVGMIALALGLWLTGDPAARARVTEAFTSVSLLLGITVPIVIVANAKSHSH